MMMVMSLVVMLPQLTHYCHHLPSSLHRLVIGTNVISLTATHNNNTDFMMVNGR